MKKTVAALAFAAGLFTGTASAAVTHTAATLDTRAMILAEILPESCTYATTPGDCVTLTVTFTEDLSGVGPYELPDGMGPLEFNVNGKTVTGKAGATGTATTAGGDGSPVFRIGGDTTIVISGASGSITGGKGGYGNPPGDGCDGTPPGAGGIAIVDASGARFAAVTDEQNLVHDGEDGKWLAPVMEALKEAFGSDATVTSVKDDTGYPTNYIVRVTADIDRTVNLPDDLGPITLDLNGHTFVGADGTDGSASTPGTDGTSAILIVKGGELDNGTTKITMKEGTAEWPATYLIVDLTRLGEPGCAWYETQDSLAAALAAYNGDDTYKTTHLALRRIRAGVPYPISNGLAALTDADVLTPSKDFCVSVFPITNDQVCWVLFGCDAESYGLPEQGKLAAMLSYVSVRAPLEDGRRIRSNEPVDSYSFMGLLAAGCLDADGNPIGGFDLPTAAQWQIAMRGGATAMLGAYVDESLAVQPITPDNFESAMYEIFDPTLSTPVGSQRPNPWGLYYVLCALLRDEYPTDEWLTEPWGDAETPHYSGLSEFDYRVLAANQPSKDFESGMMVPVGPVVPVPFQACFMPTENSDSSALIGGNGGDGYSPGAGAPGVGRAPDADPQAGLDGGDYSDVVKDGEDGEWLTPVMEALKEAFGSDATVTSVKDDTGYPTNYIVRVTADIDRTVSLPDDLGPITLDLNGHTFAGADGTDGSASTPGTNGTSAILIVKGGVLDNGTTKITMKEGSSAAEWPATYLIVDLTRLGEPGCAWYETQDSLAAALAAYNGDDTYKTTHLALRKIRAGVPYPISNGPAALTDADVLTPSKDFCVSVFPITYDQLCRVLFGCDAESYGLPGYGKLACEMPYVYVRGPIGDGRRIRSNEPVDSYSFMGLLAAGCLDADGNPIGGFDLPTAAQWQIAMRGGATAMLGAYVDESLAVQPITLDNLESDMCEIFDPMLSTPVGSQRPNPWGLYYGMGALLRDECPTDETWLTEPWGDAETPHYSGLSESEYQVLAGILPIKHVGGEITLSPLNPQTFDTRFQVCFMPTESSGSPALIGGNGGNGNPPGAGAPAVGRAPDADPQAGLDGGDYSDVVKDGEDGEWLTPVMEALKEAFGSDATVTSVKDDTGYPTNYIVRVTAGIDRTVSLPDDLGPITLDLNGHTFAGADGTDGSASTPGTDGTSAILIVKGGVLDNGTTKITMKGDASAAEWPATYLIVDLTRLGKPGCAWYETQDSLASALAAYNGDDTYKTTHLALRRIRAGVPYPISNGLAALTDADVLTPSNDFCVSVFPITYDQICRVLFGCDAASHGLPGQGKLACEMPYVYVRGSLEVDRYVRSNEPVDSDSFMDLLAAGCLDADGNPIGGFDLPTAAQWQIAMRGGATAVLGAYVDESLAVQPITPDNIESTMYEVFDATGSAPVGSQRPNPWGLYYVMGALLRDECPTDETWLTEPWGDAETPHYSGLSESEYRVLTGNLPSKDFASGMMVPVRLETSAPFQACFMPFENFASALIGGNGGDGNPPGAGAPAVGRALDADPQAGLDGGDYSDVVTDGEDGELLEDLLAAAVAAAFPEQDWQVAGPDADGWYTVILKNDLTGPVVIPDDIGKVKVDLNDWNITGPDGVAGAETDQGTDGETGLVVRRLSATPRFAAASYQLVNAPDTDNPVRPAPGTDSHGDFGDGVIAGGNGGDGNTPGDGAPGLLVEPNATPAAVAVGSLAAAAKKVTIRGGNGGNALGQDENGNGIAGGNGGPGVDGNVDMDEGLIQGGNGGNGSDGLPEGDTSGGNGGKGGDAVTGDTGSTPGEGKTRGGNGGNAGDGNKEPGGPGEGGGGDDPGKPGYVSPGIQVTKVQTTQPWGGIINIDYTCLRLCKGYAYKVTFLITVNGVEKAWTVEIPQQEYFRESYPNIAVLNLCEKFGANWREPNAKIRAVIEPNWH